MGLSDLQEAILIDLTVHGDNTPSNIGEQIGRPSSSVSRVLPDLIEEGLVRNKGSGVYTLTDAGIDRSQSLIRTGLDVYS